MTVHKALSTVPGEKEILKKVIPTRSNPGSTTH